MCRGMKERARDSQAASLEECSRQRAVRLMRAQDGGAVLPHPPMMAEGNHGNPQDPGIRWKEIKQKLILTFSHL